MFSILIPSWNNLESLRQCVQSIRKNSAQPHQIIVHVNDGSDGTREWLMREGLDATFSEANVGICYAVNEAAQLAVHDHIACLNDDMYCLPGWDAALFAHIKTLPSELFMLSGTVVGPVMGGNPCGVVADFGDTVVGFREADLLRAAPTLVRGDWHGATLPPTVVHRKWWFNCGGHSTELSHGTSSDNDFAMKLWHAGCRHFIGVGDSLVYRLQSKSTQKVATNDGQRQFLDKWGMTPATFDRFHLRRGQPLTDALLPEPEDSAALRRALWRGRVRKRFT